MTRAAEARALRWGTALAALAGETMGAYPNFIPFFNVACGGARGRRR